MKKFLLSGANGKMGRSIANCVKQRDDCEIVAGVDISGETYGSFPVYPAWEVCKEEADVLIDFSHPSALSGLLEFACARNIPCVVATTGLDNGQISMIHDAAKKIPVFFTANMSLGVNLLAELAKKAAAVLGEQFDIEIIEKHHNQKVDAPSGTALMLADELSTVLELSPQYIYDRHSVRRKRAKNEIGLHAVRGGTIVGEHEILFAGHDEVITLSHSASSKEVFATGSINAAMFLCGKQPGLYSMRDLV